MLKLQKSCFHYIAGVIGTCQAYLMNSAADGQALALVGLNRPVVGNITKGCLFATNNGVASSNGQGPCWNRIRNK